MKTSLIIIVTSLVLLLFSCSESDCPVKESEYPDILDNAVSNIYQELNIINGINSLGANMIAFTDLSSEEIYPILSDIINTYSRIEEAAFVDKNGILKYIKPDEYQSLEGSDVSYAQNVKDLHETLQPIMSQLFMSVEGFQSLSFGYPILQNDELVGSLSFLLKPHEFFDEIVEPLLEGSETEIFIAQSDGIVIYDQDEEEIGKNLATDPSYQQYPGLVEVGEKIIQNNEGTADYSFKKAGTDKDINKIAYWKSVYFFGAEWRVVVAEPR